MPFRMTPHRKTILDDAIQDSAIPDGEMEDGALPNRASHGSASVDGAILIDSRTQNDQNKTMTTCDYHYIYVYEWEEYTIRPAANNNILEEEEHEDETQYCSYWYSAYVLKNFLHCQKKGALEKRRAMARIFARF